MLAKLRLRLSPLLKRVKSWVKKIPFSKITAFAKERKLLSLAIIVGVVFVLSGLSLWLDGRESWTEHPAILRILEGTVEISTPKNRDYTLATDETLIPENSRIRSAGKSVSVLQFFDGSAVKIEGPAEVEFIYGRELEGATDLILSIRLAVLRGRVTVAAAETQSPDSLFEVQTLNSVGVVQGTMFEVFVDDDENVSWEVSQGIVRVGAIMVDSDLRAVVALLPLKPGDFIKVPALPTEWRDNPEVLARLLNATQEIVRAAVLADSPDVTIEGTSQLVSSAEHDIVVFRIDIVEVKAETASATMKLPPGYTAIEYADIKEKVPELLIAYASSIKRLSIPSLPVPGIWGDVSLDEGPLVIPEYLFSIFDISNPLDVAVDPTGKRIAVTESSGRRLVRIYDDEGNNIMDLAVPGTGTGDRAPSYLAFDRYGVLYVSDRRRRTIDMWDPNGIYIGEFISSKHAEIVWAPFGLYFDSLGDLYVTDLTEDNHRVMVFDASGKLKMEFGSQGNGNGEFSFPNGIAVDKEGTIYVSDSTNFRVQIFNNQGEFLTSISGMGLPRGIDTRGKYLYVVDSFEHTIFIFDSRQGTNSIAELGGNGIGNGEFNFPNGLELDSTGRMYIADKENNRVQVWEH